MCNIFSEVKRIELKVNDKDGWKKEKIFVLFFCFKIVYSVVRVIFGKRDFKMKDLREVLEKVI